MAPIVKEIEVTDIKDMGPRSARLKARLRHIWLFHVRPIIVIVIVLTTFRSAIADWNDVPTGSMKPSILEGDRIFVNKLAYGLKLPFTTVHIARWDKPKRGDIVVFFSPEDGTRLVKRIIGLPGDSIEMRHNRLVINGQMLFYAPITEPSFINSLPKHERPMHRYAMEDFSQHSHPIIETPSALYRMDSMPLQVVPAGNYFVLGDNRDLSWDSRYIGFVPEDQIVGRATRVAMSLDYENSYLPRWGRFWKALP